MDEHVVEPLACHRSKPPMATRPRSAITAPAALTSITDALNHTTNITSVTGGGRPLTIVDPNGATNGTTTTLTYDPRQRLLTSAVASSSGTHTTTYTYDAAGNLTKTTQPDGSYIASTYDTAHRVTKLTNVLGEYISYTLDALGDKTQIIPTTAQARSPGSTRPPSMRSGACLSIQGVLQAKTRLMSTIRMGM